MSRKSERPKTPPRLVLALDPAKAAGAAVFLDGKLVGYADADGSSWTSLVRALKPILAGYDDVPTNRRAVVLETGWAANRGAKSLHTLAVRRGLAMAAAEAFGFHSIEWVYPATWQNAMFGPLAGRDTKQLALGLAKELYGLEGVTDNVADAAVIGTWLVRQYGEHEAE